MIQRLIFVLICLMSFYNTSPLFAQRSIQSGSLQIIYSGMDPIQLDLNGPLNYYETFDGNMIISAVPPGDYIVRITTQSRRGRGSVIVDESIRIVSGMRLVIDVKSNGRFALKTVRDRNSIPICQEPTFYPQPGYGQIPPPPDPISPRDFDRLVKEIKKASFDKDKISLLNASAGYSLFYTEQIRVMMNLFSFDDGKLNCAQILAPRVYDPQNLYSLGSEFSFQSTKEKFYQFIKNNKP